MSFEEIRDRLKRLEKKVKKVTSPEVKAVFGEVYVRKLTCGQVLELASVDNDKEAMAKQICWALVGKDKKMIFDANSEEDRNLVLDQDSDAVLKLNEEITRFNAPKEDKKRKN